MQPLAYQKEDINKRKNIVLKIASRFASLEESKFPNIVSKIKSGNTRKVALLESIINQMYSLDYDLEESLLAIEENI